MVEGVLKVKGLRGLVLETFGSGNAPEVGRLLEVLRQGVEGGIVVNVTQCMTGSVSPLYATGSALARAGCNKGDYSAVMDALKAAKADGVGWLLNEFDYGGYTPLHITAISPSVDILHEFLCEGASVHLWNNDGHTPLYLAADAGMEENVNLLRNAGAHLHAEEADIAGLRRKLEASGSGEVGAVVKRAVEASRVSTPDSWGANDAVMEVRRGEEAEVLGVGRGRSE
ncbi:hypothetical protein BDZ91DRAFT_798256 [Kalaharituber pfeilii]|nr:hypothetical protein BDZ91DRAFT_798256 [Kalaharituber pfeilii]